MSTYNESARNVRHTCSARARYVQGSRAREPLLSSPLCYLRPLSHSLSVPADFAEQRMNATVSAPC